MATGLSAFHSFLTGVLSFQAATPQAGEEGHYTLLLLRAIVYLDPPSCSPASTNVNHLPLESFRRSTLRRKLLHTVHCKHKNPQVPLPQGIWGFAEVKCHGTRPRLGPSGPIFQHSVLSSAYLAWLRLCASSVQSSSLLVLLETEWFTRVLVPSWLRSTVPSSDYDTFMIESRTKKTWVIKLSWQYLNGFWIKRQLWSHQFSVRI